MDARKQAYEDGRSTRLAGRPILLNPYTTPELHAAFENGWRAEDRSLRTGGLE